MTYYVRFEDDEEYVVCAVDQDTAECDAGDMQRAAGKTQKVVDIHIVADR